MSIREMIRLFFGTLMAFSLAGCSYFFPPVLLPYKVNDIPSAIYQCKPQCSTALGIDIYRIGNKVKMIMPSNKLFYGDSANLTPAGYAMLDQAVRYLNYFNKATIKVAGHSADNISEITRDALTRKQAENVTSYLQKHDIKASLLYSDGAGAKQPISSNYTAWGRAQNNRIEITFRYDGFLYQAKEPHVE